MTKELPVWQQWLVIFGITLVVLSSIVLGVAVGMMMPVPGVK
jgi:hypothetical protein